jgi:hypothetical protein
MMFSQTLYVQWKWNRDFLAFYTAVGFAAPLVIIWIALPHLGLTSPRELVSVGGAIGAVCGGIAGLAGMSVAWQGYAVDDRVGHIYTLSLPITRLRALWLRAITAAATLMVPALGIWIGGMIAASQMNLPATLESYAGSLAIRALLTSWLVHACIFALRHSAGRKAKAILGLLAGALIVLFVLAAGSPSTREQIIRLAQLFSSSPGPFGVLFGRWTLIDV